ncbi:MAG: hypothetical protein HQL40_07575 [Alphaproteobacteria bacterium]|nr:hypothetical protein [Alphaproteobacteria bacterium]
MQLSLDFLPIPQAESPYRRLSPDQQTALLDILARIIAKAASQPTAETPTPTRPETTHD